MDRPDETDLEILQLLLTDARRPYNEIADAVDLSPPAVRDRIDRLRELGIIERFTVELDRSLLNDGLPVLVEITPVPAATDRVREALAGTDGVEHLFVTADGRVVVQTNVPEGDVRSFLTDTLEMDRIRSYDVSIVDDAEWTPQLEGTAFALECAECGNTVTAEGESERIDGALYQFCCASCRARFEEQYAQLRDGT